MFQKNDTQVGRRFLKEALPLISTYFSGDSVELAGIATSIGQDEDYESQEFGQHIRFRHAIACCEELFPIVQRIESGLSSVTKTIRTDTKGILRGRLDIPRYVARKSTSFTWPRSYPILVTAESYNTPENELIVRIFRVLLQRLPISQFPSNSAEAMLGRRYKKWITARMKRDPWGKISCTSSLPRLYMEACRRIARRQTGNEQGYSGLVSFIRDWRLVDDELAGSVTSDKFIDSLLSFPANESFFDRIYEIWCIRSIADSLSQLGAKLIAGPIKMNESRRKPIYVFEIASYRIEIWFQSSLPRENAEWFYNSTDKGLRGIPDITVIANEHHRLIIDAKNRIVTGATRSEETYKMLGYFENFRHALGAETNWGVLAFVSPNGFGRSLKSTNGRALELISAHPASFEDCGFTSCIKSILQKWIEKIGVATSSDPGFITG